MSTQYSREPLRDVVTEIEPMLREHHREVATYPDDIPLDPDWGRYEQFERDRILTIHTVRSDGRLVGYNVWLINWMLHYRRTLAAMNDLFYVAPSHRAGTIPYRLIKFSERDLIDRVNVNRILYHAKYSNQMRLLLMRLGYQPEEQILGKLVQKGV